ncbi:decaprenyl-phosphate phosphoribosyltransferase [Candidatus Magnetomonas plexicatena]|uniref:decaprenyl-phosphate phosphoribosyltransferase n=1 Tax=Candidatus Magnetomonas plexicatena TaxID=2552947 RepID=UPI001104C386|nr:decaprenyl-phosphate phosphoribosyltransferase [Nitrospirales bacterium LBB_01]
MINKILLYIKIMRPKHWVKNLFILSAPFFGGVLFTKQNILITLLSQVCFALAASAMYVFNDLKDCESDLLHPGKAHRPLASGSISNTGAVCLLTTLVVLSVLISTGLNSSFTVYMVLYLILQAGYSLYFKHIAVVDIFLIASGFVLRVFAGGGAYNVEISKWLFLTMFMVSLTLASGKRLAETAYLEKDVSSKHRKALGSYPAGLLNDVLVITSASALMCYVLYTTEQQSSLVFTVPVVTFGLIRYLALSKANQGDPTDALVKDPWLAATVIVWMLLVALLRYGVT